MPRRLSYLDVLEQRSGDLAVHLRRFGWIALIVAILNLLRPSMVLMSFALIPTSFGLVLHNTNLCGFAAALLLLSLARPAPAPE